MTKLQRETIQGALDFLPREHKSSCPEVYDRECGVCNCGKDERQAAQAALNEIDVRDFGTRDELVRLKSAIEKLLESSCCA